MRVRFSKTVLAVAGAAVVTLAAPAADGGRSAQASQWQLYASNTGVYCEGCCRSGSLCCSIDFPCRVDAPNDPPGGG